MARTNLQSPSYPVQTEFHRMSNRYILTANSWTRTAPGRSIMASYAIDKNITISDLRFHYRDWGGHGWPILMLHGLASTSHIWDLVAPLLVDDARVIAFDLRGHGQSDKPDGDYSFEAVVGDVNETLREIQMEH